MIALTPPHVNNDNPSTIHDESNDSLEASLLMDTSERLTDENKDPNDSDLMLFDEKPTGPYGTLLKFNDRYSKIIPLFVSGTRPPLPAVHIGPEYDRVLEVFIVCTDSDWKTRPSAKGLVMYFNHSLKSTTVANATATSTSVKSS